jgi:hypothetical protein
MALLKVKGYWRTSQPPLGAPEASMFRVRARRWEPVVRRERKSVPLRFALGLEHEIKANQALSGTRRNVATVSTPRSRWNPWMWVK